MPRNLSRFLDLAILHPKQAHVLSDRFALCELRLLFGRLAACEGRGGELADLGSCSPWVVNEATGADGFGDLGSEHLLIVKGFQRNFGARVPPAPCITEFFEVRSGRG